MIAAVEGNVKRNKLHFLEELPTTFKASYVKKEYYSVL